MTVDFMTNRLRQEAMQAAQAAGFDADDIVRICRGHFDTTFDAMKPEELRKMRDELRELKARMNRPGVSPPLRGRDEKAEAAARAQIAEDVRKRDGVVLNRDPLGRRVSTDTDDADPYSAPQTYRRPPA